MENNNLELFYMTKETLRAKNIYEILTENEDILVELWDDMNVLEIEFKNGDTMDVELIGIEFKDSSDQAFVKNRGINTIFAIGVRSENVEDMKRIFMKIIDKSGGFVCTDSEDFKPFYLEDR